MRLNTAKDLRVWAARNELELYWFGSASSSKVCVALGTEHTSIMESYHYPDTTKGQGDAMKDLRRRVNAILEADK